jgi:hypothetical protein
MQKKLHKMLDKLCIIVQNNLHREVPHHEK